MARLIRTETVPVTTLVDYPGNARRHDDKALDESVALHGQYRALLVRELPDGRLQLLAGHGTKGALQRAGRTDVEVEVRDVPDDDEARRIVLADNRISDLAGYDNAALLALVDQASQNGGLTGTGFDADAYQAMLDGGIDDLIDQSRTGDSLPEEGDADTTERQVMHFGVIVECDNDAEQIGLIERLSEEGFSCRAMI